MGITRLHNFEHRNKAYFKVFKVEYVKLFVLGKSHKQMFFCSFVLLIEIQSCYHIIVQSMTDLCNCLNMCGMYFKNSSHPSTMLL